MDQTVLAFPPSTCCFGGFRHSGTPRGRLERIGGIDTYISVPLKDSDGEDMDGDVDGDRGGGGNGKVLLYFSDAFGLYENAFLMMDGFAAKGWVVLGVDYFKGVSIFLDFFCFSFFSSPIAVAPTFFGWLIWFPFFCGFGFPSLAWASHGKNRMEG